MFVVRVDCRNVILLLMFNIFQTITLVKKKIDANYQMMISRIWI